MRKKIEQIEIKEPPIEEFKKKKSCAKRSCSTGCGCIVIFLLVSLLLLKFIAGPRTKELKNPPDNFPSNITLYDKDEIKSISFISGKQKSRSVELAAFIPKLVLSPIILMFDDSVKTQKIIKKDGEILVEKKATWSDYFRLVKEPVTDQRDIVQIEWNYLTAEPDFIYEYFQNELKKNKYIIELISTNNKKKFQFTFIDEKNNINGVLYIQDDAQDRGTDYLSLTVNIPPQK